MYTFPIVGLVMKKLIDLSFLRHSPFITTCSIWKWVAYVLNVCILETKPTDEEFSAVAELFKL